jgi:CBS domain-containing protein
MNRKVRDLMHRGVFTCFPDTPIQEAARMMVDHDISALVVIDESERMLGLLSRTDLVKLRLLTPDKERWRELPVENIMIKNVVQVDIDDTLHQASEIIMSRHIHRVVVTEETEDGSRKAVGILSITDIARDMAL